MYQLSLNNIDQIRSDIDRQRVSYSHLLDDLTDHVCCDVEHEMNSGLSFDKAYSNVKKVIGFGRFKKIQVETLLLIDKNYRTMKTFVKIFGALSPTLLALGALFKIQHWPGASIMLVLGFFFLCCFFLPSSVYVLYTENKSSKKHLLMQLSGLISSVIFLIGILFKVQHWPGAGILILVGMVLVALVFLPSLVFSKISDDKGEGKRTAYLIGLLAGVVYIAGFLFKLMHWPGAGIVILPGLILSAAIFLPAFSYAHFKNELYVKGRFIFLIVTIIMAVLSISFMSLNVSKNIFSEFVVAESQMDKVLNDLTQKNNQLAENLTEEYGTDETLSEILTRTGDIDNWIRDLKRELIISVNPANSEALIGDDIDCSRIIRKDAVGIPTDILIGTNNNGKAYELSDKLLKYKEFLIAVSNEPELVSKLGILLDISDKKDLPDYTYTWEQNYFEYRSLMSVLNSLTSIQIELKLVEKEVLNILSRKESLTAQHIITTEIIPK